MLTPSHNAGLALDADDTASQLRLARQHWSSANSRDILAVAELVEDRYQRLEESRDAFHLRPIDESRNPDQFGSSGNKSIGSILPVV
jgi:hypothetical protein